MGRHGKTVLVTGGAGAVGTTHSMGVLGGAKVISTVSSPQKADDAKAAGADGIINYREEDVAARILEETNGEGVDHICEVEFGATSGLPSRSSR